MTSKINYLAIAIALTGDQPLAYAAKDDGSLVVVAQTGQKFRYTAEQVAIVAEKLAPKPKPTTKTTPAAAPKPQTAPAAKKPVSKTSTKK